MKRLKKHVKHYLECFSKATLALLMVISGMSSSLMMASSMQTAYAAELKPEGYAEYDGSGEGGVQGIEVDLTGTKLALHADDDEKSDKAFFYKMKVDGQVALCMNHGKGFTPGYYARVEEISNSLYKSIYYYYADQGWSAENRAKAQALVWCVKAGMIHSNLSDDEFEDLAKVFKALYKAAKLNFDDSFGGDLMFKMNFIYEYNQAIGYDYGSRTLYRYVYGTGNNQDFLCPAQGDRPTYDENRVQESYTATDEFNNKVTVHKTDAEKGTDLSGIAFDFYRDGTKIGSDTTDSSGEASFTYKETVTRSATSDWFTYVETDAQSPYNLNNLSTSDSESVARTKAKTQAQQRAEAAVEAVIETQHSFYAIETKTRTKYWLNPDASQTATRNVTGKGAVNLTLTNMRQKGEIDIIKKDVESGNGVPGAIYGLYANETITHPDGKTGTLYTKDQLVAQFPATDSNGATKLTELYHGKYYVQEITASDKYLVDTEKHEVEILDAGTSNQFAVTINVEVTEKSVRGVVGVTKYDKNLYNKTDNADVVDANKDGAQGDATLEGALYGLYAAENIVHPDTHIGVVTYNDKTGAAQHEIRLTKGTDLSVKGVKATAGTLLATAKTDANGEIQFENLYLGKYYIQEIEPSEGYLLDTTRYNFDVAYEGQTKAIVTHHSDMTEQVIKRGFDIQKFGHKAGQSGVAVPLEGVEFTVKLESDVQRALEAGYTIEEIYNERLQADGSLVDATRATAAQKIAPTYDVLITNKDGKATSKDLPYATGGYYVPDKETPGAMYYDGGYRIRETKPAVDYNKANDCFVEIDTDSRTPRTTLEAMTYIVDENYQTYLQVVKLDADSGKQILHAGTEFKIKAVSNGLVINGQTFNKGDYIGYTVMDSTPHWVNTWTTNDEGYIMLQVKLPAGEYEIEELHATFPYVLGVVGPDGTVSNDPWKFTITNQVDHAKFEDGTDITKAEIKDTPVKGRINVEKRGEVLVGFDGDFKYEIRGIAGAVFDVYAKEDIADPSNDGTLLYEAGDYVTSITTQAEGKGQSELLPLGEYTVIEKTAPEGFVHSDESFDVALVYEDETVSVVYDSCTFTNDRQKVELNVIKKDEETEYPLAGAVFGIYAQENITNADGEVIVNAGTELQQITSDKNGKIRFTLDFPLGFRFEVKEVRAPLGFVSDKDNVLVYEPTYIGQDSEKTTLTQEFLNKPTVVELSKKVITTSEELEDCLLAVYPVVNGKIQYDAPVDEWKSTNEPHIIKRLHVDQEYALVERMPANGYTTANVVYFVVRDVVEIQKVEMFNELTEVRFTKVDIETKESVLGALMGLFPADEKGQPIINKMIDSWVTDGTVHSYKGLVVGQKYVVRELEAPFAEGYVTAPDVVFTVEDNLKGQDVVIEDDFTKLQINKIDEATLKLLPGVTLALYGYDEEGHISEEPIEQWVTDGKSKVFERLPIGKYLLEEVETLPGYTLAKPLEIELVDTTEVQLFTMVNAFHKVDVRKLNLKTSQYVVGARLALCPVIDGEIQYDTPFATWTTDNKAFRIERVPAGEFAIVELATPKGSGYLLADPIFITVEDIEEVQSFIMYDDFTKVEISKQDMVDGSELEDAHLQIIDPETGKVIKDWVTNGERTMIENVLQPGKQYILKEITAPDGYLCAESVLFTVLETGEIQTVVMKDAREPKVKTGDNTDIATYAVGAGIGAVAGMGVYLASKKRKEEDAE